MWLWVAAGSVCCVVRWALVKLTAKLRWCNFTGKITWNCCLFLLCARCSGAEYCDQPVCVYVCLSVGSHILKATRANFTTFSVRVNVAIGSEFQFCEWRHLWPIRSIMERVGHKWKTTQRFRTVRQVAAPGAKSAVRRLQLAVNAFSCLRARWLLM